MPEVSMGERRCATLRVKATQLVSDGEAAKISHGSDGDEASDDPSGD
jgi:hypothetical protein